MSITVKELTERLLSDPAVAKKLKSFLAGPKERVSDPELMKLPVSTLLVDERYQRDLAINTIKKALRFDPWLAQVLTVTKRPNGTFYVADGQHKATMAEMSGVEEVMCQVIDLTHCSNYLEIEAELFTALNINRKATSQLDKLRSGTVYGDKKALSVQEQFEDLGIQCERFGPSDGVVVTTFDKLKHSLSQFGLEYTREAIELLKIVANKTEGWDSVLSGALIDGVAQTLKFNEETAFKYDLKTFMMNNLGNLPVKVWIKGCGGVATSSRVIARKIIDQYNNSARVFITSDTMGNYGLALF